MAEHRPGTHPDLVAALDLAWSGDAAVKSDGFAALIRIALRASSSGDSCRCEKPLLAGLDLMCARCLLNSRAQELRRLDAMGRPHDFVAKDGNPRKLASRMCDVCSGWTDDARHAGETKTMRTSWGTSYDPPAFDDASVVESCDGDLFVPIGGDGPPTRAHARAAAAHIGFTATNTALDELAIAGLVTLVAEHVAAPGPSGYRCGCEDVGWWCPAADGPTAPWAVFAWDALAAAEEGSA
ncbi:MAG: hypothetical protein JWM89_1827 [Acidimicrobiales bacterium]|nr:hypothetical protein [Acidimicrobiales bacterium]